MASLDCLTIDTASRWMLVSPDSMTNPHSERVMQPAPGAIVPLLPEVDVNTLPQRKVTRQHPPLDATHSQVEHGINHQTHVQTAWSPARFGCGNQMLDNRPLAVSQICWVSFCFHKDYVYHNLADSLYFSNSLSRSFFRNSLRRLLVYIGMMLASVAVFAGILVLLAIPVSIILSATDFPIVGLSNVLTTSIPLDGLEGARTPDRVDHERDG